MGIMTVLVALFVIFILIFILGLCMAAGGMNRRD